MTSARNCFHSHYLEAFYVDSCSLEKIPDSHFSFPLDPANELLLGCNFPFTLHLKWGMIKTEIKAMTEQLSWNNLELHRSTF